MKLTDLIRELRKQRAEHVDAIDAIDQELTAARAELVNLPLESRPAGITPAAVEERDPTPEIAVSSIPPAEPALEDPEQYEVPLTRAEVVAAVRMAGGPISVDAVAQKLNRRRTLVYQHLYNADRLGIVRRVDEHHWTLNAPEPPKAHKPAAIPRRCAKCGLNFDSDGRETKCGKCRLLAA